MTTKLSIISAIIVTVLLTGCIHENSALNLPSGKYQKDVSSTDVNGTTTEQKTSTDVSVDENGHKTAVVESKTTKDPKGLFNKTTTSQTKVIESNQ